MKQLKNNSNTALISDFEIFKKCQKFYQQLYTKIKQMQWNYLSITSFKNLYTTIKPQGINDSHSNSNISKKTNFSLRE